MPLPETKGGPTPLGHDSTAGKRGLPRRAPQSGGPGRFVPDRAPEGEPIGTNVRGGTTDGLYESPLRRRTPTPGSGTGM